MEFLYFNKNFDKFGLAIKEVFIFYEFSLCILHTSLLYISAKFNNENFPIERKTSSSNQVFANLTEVKSQHENLLIACNAFYETPTISNVFKSEFESFNKLS